MSKYDQYLKEFLLKNSELSIEKIGVFTLSPSAAGEKSIQPQSVTFQFSKRAQTSEELIDYIASQTAKNKILISSDLSSIFDEARQYVNIGKVFSFAGLGNISLNRNGEYEFSAGTSNVSVADNNYNTRPETEAVTKGRTGRNAVIFIAFLIILLVAGGLGWGIYKYINQKKSEPATAAEPGGTPPPVSATRQNADSTTATAQQALSKPSGDTAEYKFIFETTNSSFRAYKRYDSLKAWKENCLIDSVRHDTSVVYHLYVNIKAPAKDTLRIKDSLQKYYDRPTPIIIQHN